jgi:hypothetical protein
MSFLKIFNGDAGKSNLLGSESAVGFKKISVSGLRSSPGANGEYAPNGEICNCAPLFKNNSTSSNLSFANSSNFFNLDDFYLFSSFSLENTKGDFSNSEAYPSNIDVKSGGRFNDSTHYVDFNLNTNLNNDSLPNFSYIGLLFDDPLEAKKPNYINYKLDGSLVNLSFSFIFDPSNQPTDTNGFSIGILLRQQDNYYTFDLGRTGNSTDEESISVSKNLKSEYFNLISGNGSLKPNLSGDSPYEIGFLIGDSKSGARSGSISNVRLNFYSVSNKDYYIFREGDSTILSDQPCSAKSSSNFIYSSDAIDSDTLIFDGDRGSSSIFSDEVALGKAGSPLEAASVTKKSHSDLDGVYDSLDLYPMGKDSADISIFRYSNISGIHHNQAIISFNIEGFQYVFDGSITPKSSLTEVYEYISSLVNQTASSTGIYSEADDTIQQLLFWRPKEGPVVRFYMNLEYRDETTRINWELADENVNYTSDPPNPSAPTPAPFDPFA